MGKNWVTSSSFRYRGKGRDRAIFMLMLRCGLRVEEVAHLRLQDLDLSQRWILVCQGKGNKDWVVLYQPGC